MLIGPTGIMRSPTLAFDRYADVSRCVIPNVDEFPVRDTHFACLCPLTVVVISSGVIENQSRSVHGMDG